MIAILVRAFLALVFHDQGAALARTAPEPISAELGAEHFVASRLAGARFGIDPDLLLAIAARESHYTDVKQLEANGLESCGPLTPEQLAHCEPAGVLAGYLRGAAHFREWMDARGLSRTPELREQLQGLAGGYPMIHDCRVGKRLTVRRGVTYDLCDTSWRFLWGRVAWIRRERAKGGAS